MMAIFDYKLYVENNSFLFRVKNECNLARSK